MNKSPLLLALALLFLLAANLHLCCRVGVDGEWTLTRYSLADVRRGELAAREAAEEICPHGARMPQLEERFTLSFRPPDGSSRDLSARILARVSGVSQLYSVKADGCSFGTVADRDRLEERLRAALYSAMPAGAMHAYFARGVEITPVYGRSGSAMSPSDMALVVAQVVPAIFTDREGQRVMG
ncbi:MAG: hypothetical protein IKD61_08385 [Oscillospiraceae bacterium]|nr:hypothetical protein [Oscillospiraceae bacterium]